MAPLVEFPCSLPSDTVPQEVDATAIASLFANQLHNLSESSFIKDAVWKDVFALSGTISTFYSATSIFEAWKETSIRADVDSFDLDLRSVRVVRLPGTSWIEARYSFMTNSSPSTSCSAVVNLVSEPDGKWRIWVMRTILEQLRGQSSVDELEPVSDTNKASDQGSVSHFDCVVIGGGQAGLSMGGRLKAMGIDYVVLDKYREVGDSWKQRYGSAKCECSAFRLTLTKLMRTVHTTREYGTSHRVTSVTRADTLQLISRLTEHFQTITKNGSQRMISLKDTKSGSKNTISFVEPSLLSPNGSRADVLHERISGSARK
jgi:hypothetical protein